MRYERNPIQNDARKVERADRLGPNACCALCGEPELAVLTTVKKKLLEDHHALGREYDEASTVPLCRNCHAKETESLRDVGAEMDPPPTLPEKIVSMLRSLAAFFGSLAEACACWAERLAAWIRQLDDRFPSWRAEVAT